MTPQPVAEQFISLLENSDVDGLTNLLKSLTDADKKKLRPELKRLTKEYGERGEVKKFGVTVNSWGHIKGSDLQRNLLATAAFVCFSRGDFARDRSNIWWIKPENIDAVLEWYCPSWFSDYLNGSDTIGHGDYFWYIELIQKGHLQAGKELIARVLTSLLHVFGSNPPQIEPERLLRFPITLEEHIWYFFEVESSINHSDRWPFVPAAQQGHWVSVFLKYSAEGRLSRPRLLQESLLASNRNFNKTLSGWFGDLFAALEPTVAELLELQKELFTVLGSPNGKPVNAALQALKKVAGEPGFAASGFLDMAPVVLASSGKATLSSCLMILEKLAQKAPEHRGRITQLACQCFLSKEEEVQTRAAKLIQKFGAADDEELRREVRAYEGSLLSGARALVAAWLGTGPGPEVSATVETVTDSTEVSDITMPATIDDLVFLASQAFDNNEPWHIDVLAAALVQWAPRLKPDDVALLEPAFQRALAMTGNGFRSNNGQLDHLLAFFFIDFGNWLVRKFPAVSERIKAVYRVHDGKNELGGKTSFLVIPDSGSYIFRWKRDIAFYEPYKLLLLTALDRIRGGSPLPLLSTPAQTPCWIPAETLIRRLHHYQELGQEPENIDLQIALSRCYWQDADALPLVRQLLTGELRELMIFLLDADAPPKGPFRYKAAWMVASLTRQDKKEWPAFADFSYSEQPMNNYTGKLQWESTVERFVLKHDDWRTGKKKGEEDERKALIVQREYSRRSASFAGKILAKLMPAKKEDPPMLYDFLHYRAREIGSVDNDIRRILSLAPHNPDPLVGDTITQCLRSMDPAGEAERRLIVAMEQFLYEVWDRPGEMSMLFLGTCLLVGDKTIAQTAAEIWLKAVSADRVDNVALGRIVGLHERIEFVPLKRFTDLVSQSLFKVSARHDRELGVLIGSLLAQLPEEPVRGLKRLLELYGEQGGLGDGALPEAGSRAAEPESVLARLRVWEANVGLKKVVGALLTRG